jgi:hypothetical protein
LKTIAIIQPFYIPWKGYFDIINDSDEFILYGDVRYTEHSWLNRNQIKTPGGAQWITIPVRTKGRYEQAIDSAELVDSKWAKKHFNTIQSFYSKAPFWKKYKEFLHELYILAERETHISKINEWFLREICKLLSITTEIKLSNEYPLTSGKTEKLLDMCLQAKATRYISGSVAKDYIDPTQFEVAGIELIWKDYSSYPEYPQLHGDFLNSVSVIDLLLNVGDDAPYYIWGWRKNK